MTEQDVIKRLRKLCESSKRGQAEIAKRFEVSPSYLSDMLAGKRALAPRVLSGMGIERKITVTYYER